jgi:hypothetical protein
MLIWPQIGASLPLGQYGTSGRRAHTDRTPQCTERFAIDHLQKRRKRTPYFSVLFCSVEISADRHFPR